MENIIITTSDTISLLPNSLPVGWVSVNVGYMPIEANISYTDFQSPQVVCATIASPCNFATFANNSFVDFERKMLSSTVLFSNNCLPTNSYGIDMYGTPVNVSMSSSLTDEQKGAISFSLSCQNEGYYVIVSVAETSTTFTGYLKSCGVPFDTPENIKKMLNR